ncbi:MAG TPA: plastocyanin/azurin family copper-binding protein [Acidimicrobiales bacterium]|nr:plastocyanin/azurin family copper-binding protein [Acidimicrobiales bacterium]
MTRNRPLYAAALVSIALLGACGGSDDDAAAPTTASTAATATGPGPSFGAAATVMLKDIKFSPGTVEVKAGAEVRWLWQEKIPHNVTFEGFKSDTKDNGEFRHTFDKAGSFKYSCTVHPGMNGTVEVT